MRAWSTGAGDMRRARAACEKLVALLGDECPTVSGHTPFSARVGWVGNGHTEEGAMEGNARVWARACWTSTGLTVLRHSFSDTVFNSLGDK